MNEQETLVKLAYEQGRKDGLKEAAKICDELVQYYDDQTIAPQQCAYEIRKMI